MSECWNILLDLQDPQRLLPQLLFEATNIVVETHWLFRICFFNYDLATITFWCFSFLVWHISMNFEFLRGPLVFKADSDLRDVSRGWQMRCRMVELVLPVCYPSPSVSHSLSPSWALLWILGEACVQGMSLSKHSRRISCIRQKKGGKLQPTDAVKQAYHFQYKQNSVIKMLLSAKLPIHGLAPDKNQMGKKKIHLLF